MEAGAAAGAQAPGAGDSQQEGQDGQQQDGQQQGQQPDISALVEQLGGQTAQLEQMRTFMEEQQVAQQQTDPAAEQQPQEVDLSFVNPESANYDPERAAQELLTVLQDQQSTAVSEAVAPLQEQLQTMQTQREADALASEFPELENEETANAVLKATGEWVRAAGLPPEAAGNMQVVRAVFMMGRAAQLHNEENSPGSQQSAAHLEGAGGASPGGGASGGLTAESIVNGGGRRSPLPFG